VEATAEKTACQRNSYIRESGQNRSAGSCDSLPASQGPVYCLPGAAQGPSPGGGGSIKFIRVVTGCKNSLLGVSRRVSLFFVRDVAWSCSALSKGRYMAQSTVS
jgi:hypothetical protein